MTDKILNHFKKNDPVLYSFFLKIKIKPIKKDKPQNYFYRLCEQIICQQLSEKAGDAIFTRFNKLFSKDNIHPQDILSLPHEKIRATGMSNSKVKYVKNLAEAIVNQELKINILDQLTDEKVIEELIKIKGIGPWTAEMFLMFVLGRENIFSYGDLGLRKAIKKIYGFKKDPTKNEIKKIITHWSPYKTHASRILWYSLNT